MAAIWATHRAEVVARGTQIMELLRTFAAGAKESLKKLRKVHTTTAFDQIKARFDHECGGFGTAPKFPRPVTLCFLFRLASGRGMETPVGKSSLEMTLFTLSRKCFTIRPSWRRYT